MTSLLVATLGAEAADWRASLQRAVDLHGSGDLNGASGHYRAALQAHEPLRGNWAILTNYGLAIQPKAPAETVDAFEQVLALIPDSADGHFNLGNALTDCERHAEAASAFGRAIAINPVDGEAYYNLGVQQLRQGGAAELSDAATSLSNAVSLTPSDGKAWLSMGDVRAKEARWAESVQAYTRATALRPTHTASWAALGNAHEETGAMGEAETSWRRALRLPDDGVHCGVHCNMGALLRRADRMPESRAAYNAAVRLDPGSVEGYMGLGKCFDARQLLKSQASDDGEEEESGGYLAFLAQTYGVAISLQPRNAGAYNAVGEGMKMYGLHGGTRHFGGRGALQMYEAALALSPGNTCAATHVAYGHRSPATASTATAAAAIATFGGAGQHSPARDGEDSCAEATLFGEDAAPSGLHDLCVADADSGGMEHAAQVWREHGVVIFPSLLDESTVRALRSHVRDAQHGNHTRDYTAVTRDQTYRTHKALPVDKAAPALDAVARSLQPFLNQALGSDELALLESGFMVTEPGASEQQFHRDVAPAVVSRSSVTVSIQISLVDTEPTQGALEVVPGSHAFDPAVSDRVRLADASLPKVPVAVPAGTVTVYALHLIHRGRGNTHDRDRPFFFFTLMGDGLAPPGLAYTIEPDDIGRWQMAKGGVEPQRTP